jgi:hypothetical protein
MIREYLQNTLNEEQLAFIGFHTADGQAMLKQLETSIVKNQNNLNLTNFAHNPKLVRDFTFGMSKLNLGTSTVNQKVAKFEFNLGLLNAEELYKFRLYSKLDQALMREDLVQYDGTKTKVGKKRIDVSLRRKGFDYVAKNSFQLDVDKLKEYQRPIRQNIVKSLAKSIEEGKIKDSFFADPANYRRLANLCIANYLDKDASYNLEENLGENRGRANFKALKRIGNPVQYKDFRALLKVPANRAIKIRAKDTQAMEDIYYFIAELTGHKCLGGTYEDKVQAGKSAYFNRELPRLDLSTDHGREELHELIWLERVYSKLDKVHSKAGTKYGVLWDIPLEVDATMSLAQVIGALLNEERLLEATNVIGDTLNDAWYIPGVRRKAGKLYGTPTSYGSSASVKTLIANKGYLHTQLHEDTEENRAKDKAEIKAIQREFSKGKFSVIKQFKDCMIKNYNVHTPILTVKLWDETFQVHVNKWKYAGSTTVLTEGYNTQTGKFKRAYTHVPKLVPDYDHMKLYFQTLLVHGLDGMMMNKIALAHKDKWMITIHDAILCLPGHGRQLREAYVHQLKQINNNRHQIIRDYRQSIGATTPRADVMFMKLYQNIKDAGEVAFKHTAMK